MKYKILAVDDNPINIKLLGRALVNSDYEILTAGSGTEALNIANSNMPDLILLDVMMDDMDGYEVCSKLQDNPATNHIPVIFLSAKNDSVDKARGLAVGGVDYLTKPFDAVEINARVRAHLSIRKNAIKLQRENIELKEKLELADLQISGYLQNIRTNVKFSNEHFSCFARVKSSQSPQNIRFAQLWNSGENCVFAILNGFEKDFATLAVELLFEQFAAGYLEATGNCDKGSKEFIKLVDRLMERFSPDVYKVAFSFALGWLNVTNRKLKFFGVRQALPLVLDKAGKCLPANSKVLNVQSKFEKYISANEVKLPKAATFCFLRRGIDEIPQEEYQTLFAPFLKDKDICSEESMDVFMRKLPGLEEDQLVGLISIK